MRFTIKGQFKENVYNLMRKIGYHFHRENKEKSELSFIRLLGRIYPRFHLYLKVGGNDLIFNLHLDQKKPIYKGVTAHSGEYEGEIIEEEVKRIKQLLESNAL